MAKLENVVLRKADIAMAHFAPLESGILGGV
jgi:hypothetical protein